MRERVIFYFIYIYTYIQITKRINELEQFYEDNIEDIRVTNFEKARIRLKKLLMYDLETINKIENCSNLTNIFTTTHIQSTPIKEAKELQANMRKMKFEEEHKTEEKKIKNSSIDKKLKNRKPGNYMKPLDKDKRHRVKGQIDNQGTFGSIRTDNSENGIDIAQFNRCKEIIFKIKMTETEYKALVKEKSKLNSKANLKAK